MATMGIISRIRGLALTEVSAIGARRQSCDPAKRRAEGAYIVVSDSKANIGHRRGVLCQQCLGTFDALAQLVALGRHSEGLTKRAAQSCTVDFFWRSQLSYS